MKEFDLIETYFKPLTKNSKASQKLLDDVARISVNSDEELIISKDIFFEDVHFLLKDGGFNIASKLLRANLSDLASSGAKPLYYMLGFSKNDKLDKSFYNDFSNGLTSLQDEFGISLIGGDTIQTKKKSDRLFFSITIFGSVKKNKSLLRNKAKAGDLIFVSGSIGDACLGLDLSLQKSKEKFSKKEQAYFLNRHFYPEPRINLGKELLKKDLSQCAIDISDGLIADLNQVCKSSKLGAKIYLDQIPLSKEAKKSSRDILDLISAGDDYELLFASNKENLPKIKNLSKKLGIKLTHIGEFIKSQNFQSEIFQNQLNSKKISIKLQGYEH